MRWKLISLSAVLIAVTNAQFLTIDNNIIVEVLENVTFNPEDHTVSLADDVETDKSIYIDSTTHKTSPSSKALGIDSSTENNIEQESYTSDSLFDTKPEPSSRQTRETSESQSIEGESSKISKSKENVSSKASSQENVSADKPASSENDSQDKPNSDEVTSEIPNTTESETNEKPGSGEVSSVEKPVSGEELSIEKPESGEMLSIEKPESGEMLSIEKPESNQKPDSSFAASRSSGDNSFSSNEDPSGEPCGTTDEQRVQTTHGPVRGQLWMENSKIMAYIDIPYGQFHGPFEAPVTAQSWLDVHNVTKHTKQCPRFYNDEYTGDTDCLTLSIFTPKDAENVSVLFHIYDGYSKSMSADPLIYGPDYLVAKGVILVLPNYRLGPMGFLCMQNDTAPGNAGLKDLSLALEWIKENIHFFGGNPSNIVVSGDGAAGAFSSYLALCSRSRYYINKVIAESGSALSHWALDRDPIDTAYKLADNIRSEHSDGALYNNTFDEVALETIMKAAKGMRFYPCLEHDLEPFMNDTPWHTLHNMEIDTTFMIGSASYAGAHEALATVDFDELNANFSQFLPKDLIFSNDNERNAFAQKLKAQYFKEDSITASKVKELSRWYTDASYLSPVIRLARPLLKAGATVYLYEFSFVGELNRELESMNKVVPEAVRGDIVGYLFHKDGSTVEDNSPEKHMIDLMVDLWVSFINTGKPVAEKVEWNQLKKVEDSEEEWLVINSEPKMEKGIHVDRLRLWTRLYNEHFIENSSALRNTAHHYLAVAAVLMCWMANNKLDYNSQ